MERMRASSRPRRPIGSYASIVVINTARALLRYVVTHNLHGYLVLRPARTDTRVADCWRRCLNETLGESDGGRTSESSDEHSLRNLNLLQSHMPS